MTAPRGLYCVAEEGLPATSVAVLRDACAQREVPFYVLAAHEAVDCSPLPPGRLLFNPSTSAVALAAEQALFGPGVATFHGHHEGPLVEVSNPDLRLARAGVPMPRGLTVWRLDMDALPGYIEALGGLPVVVKAGGGEGGVGVMRADSWPALISLVEFLISAGHAPRLEAFVPDAVHHRLVVVGSTVVASYLNPVDEGDFRSCPSEDADEYRVGAPEHLAQLAVKAAAAVGTEFAGVDVLVHSSGRPYVLEVNSPCYYPQAELVGGIPVALPMLDFLLAKAARLAA